MSDNSERPKAAAPTPLSGIASVDEHGDEPMTSGQADVLRALCDANGETFDQTLSRDAAAARIEELKGENDIIPPQS